MFLVNIVLGLFLVHNDPCLFQTNFMGMNEQTIRSELNDHYSSFKENTTFINNTYNYLKYEDSIREITILFFLNDDNECRMIRIMSAYSNYNDLLKEVRQNYHSLTKNNWVYNSNNINYLVKLEEGDWFFTISIQEE